MLVTAPTWQFVSRMKSVYVLAGDYLCQLDSLCRFPSFYAGIMRGVLAEPYGGCSVSGVQYEI